MLLNIDFRKGIVAALLVLHIAWVANHLRLVANDQIDPWKLGGYGMYTVPARTARLMVFDAAIPEQPTKVNLIRYLTAQRFTNPGRVFRCAHPTTASLQALIYENRNLIGRNIVLVVSENRFVRNPPSVSRRVQGVVKVTWQDMQTFTYVSKFCDSEHTETAKWDE
jgi:hypothetical protein